ncbi:MAG: hypothetical protein IJ600_09015 [Lachnospiraceae bacterium]|nr:hypothetical protein [Lachnospiraceae bacterium]
MKKRMLALVTTGVLSLAMLAGCGNSTPAETAPAATEAEATEAPKGEGAENPGEVGMANPWHEISEAEANELIPRLFKAPEGAEVLGWSVLEDIADPSGVPGPMVELQYSLDGNIFNARAQVTGDSYDDISGLFYEWTVKDEATLSNWGFGSMQAKTFRNVNETGMVDLITWYDTEIGISYALSVAAADLEGFDITAVADQMYSADNEVFTGPALKDDDPEFISGQIETALADLMKEVHGDQVEEVYVYVDKIYDREAEQAFEVLRDMNLSDSEVAFEAHCELKPAEGADIDMLMLPDGQYDEAKGLVTDIYRLGVLTLNTDGNYTVEHLGTGW